MTEQLRDASYGKDRVRVMRIQRHSTGPQAHHTIRELTVTTTLYGKAFDVAFTKADNSTTVPTDTQKNLVQIVAARNPEVEDGIFLDRLASELLDRYDMIERVMVEGVSHPWARMTIQGEAHPHAFVSQEGSGGHYLRLEADRSSRQFLGGVKNRLILKSTGSEYVDYIQDDATSLPETKDRFFASRFDAYWTYETRPDSFDRAAERILGECDHVFAATHSISVQDTIWRMGQAALAAVPEIGDIRFEMPNKHYIPLDLSRFGIEDSSGVLLPTDEPFGHIEATVTRG